MFAKFFASLVIGISAIFGWHGAAVPVPDATANATATAAALGATSTAQAVAATDVSGRASAEGQSHAVSNMPKALSQADLLALSSDRYASGGLPLGDGKYVTNGPKKGSIYLCNVPRGDGGGAGADGNWIHGSTWDPSEKVSVGGSVSWPNAAFSDTVAGNSRTLSGNGLPISHTTGVYPVASDDPAYAYDRNPNSIKAQSMKDVLPANPAYSDAPNCMGMEVGVMISGVPLFAGFDAELRDAAAHEVQDSCSGHPEKNGQYHYHSLPACFKDISVSTVLGFALDGFPITGPKVAEGRYLTTDSLDVCHGITSEISVDGKKKTTYHYVMTQDFPYSASCFRGKPVSLQVLQGAGRQGNGGSNSISAQGNVSVQGQAGTPGQPPQEAIAACSGLSDGEACSFSAPRGTISGSCQTTPDGSVACVPAGR